MKKNFAVKAWIWWLLALIGIVGFILINGLLDYNASHAFSGWLVRLLGLDSKAGAEIGDFLLRKLAHITEYSLLGLLTQTIRFLLKKQGKNIKSWVPLLFILAVGILDEFFQSFSSRTGAVSDVILDFAGAMLGIGVVVVFRECQRRVRQKRNGTQRHNSKLED